jgi:hypothetical protein
VPLEWHYFKHSLGQCISTVDKTKDVLTHDINGKFDEYQSCSRYDLFLKEPEMFVNEYQNQIEDGDIYHSFDIAKKHCPLGGKSYRLVEVTDK